MQGEVDFRARLLLSDSSHSIVNVLGLVDILLVVLHGGRIGAASRELCAQEQGGGEGDEVVGRERNDLQPRVAASETKTEARLYYGNREKSLNGYWGYAREGGISSASSRARCALAIGALGLDVGILQGTTVRLGSLPGSTANQKLSNVITGEWPRRLT